MDFFLVVGFINVGAIVRIRSLLTLGFKMKIKNKLKLYIVIVIGVATLVFSIDKIIDTVYFLTNCVEVNGEIIDLKTGPKGSVWPIYSFIDSKGKKHIKESNSSTSYLQVFAQVKIIYLPDNPNDSHINEFINIWGAAIVSFIFGLGFVGLPIMALLSSDN